MIDFNMSEIVVLAVFAVIIFGPDKLPELARKAARVLNYVRNIANDAQGRLRDELGPEFADLQLADLNPRTLVQTHVLNPVQAELEPLRHDQNSPAGTADVSQDPQQAVEAGARPPVAFDTEAT